VTGSGIVTKPAVLAVIPARGGSKGVPNKNVTPVAGVPLVVRAISACLAAKRVTDVVVSTDDDHIAEVAAAAGAKIVRRPDELANDTATSESALLHALDSCYPNGPEAEVVMLVQCTSPFLTSAEIDTAASAILDGGFDSAFTAVESHGFLWRIDESGSAYGVNHDQRGRPRRQDRPKEYLETGAAYAMRTEGFRTAKHRFFGTIKAIPTDPARVLEIDEPTDLARANLLAQLIDNPPQINRSLVDAAIFDFDGTMTDDRVWIAADGTEQVATHRGDGMGVAALRRSGLPMLILSSEVNNVVTARAKKLQIDCIHGVEDKTESLKQWCERNSVDLSRVLYVGNDLNDLPCMRLVGWPIAVASAHDSVKAAAVLTTTTPGGYGAVREVASWLLGKELGK
jgi:YrbI family 3-deoxy-D-manno-octulosonate 8-phosphate phosphatase